MASGSLANSSRIKSNAPVYVAGVELGVFPSGDWSTLITLSISSSPSIASWAPGVCCARCKVRAAAFQRMSSTSELLPDPDTPVTAITVRERKPHIQVPQVMLPRAFDDDRRAIARAIDRSALLGDRYRGPAAQVSAGQRLGRRLHFCGPADGCDFAAPFSRPGPEIDQMIGGLDDLSVMLDQNERVAQVAQMLERSEQAGVIAGVQSDRRLVEDIENTRQSAADLAGKTNALALAAGKRRRAASQAQVIEADVDQKFQAIAHLAQQVARDVLFVGVERQIPERRPEPDPAASG